MGLSSGMRSRVKIWNHMFSMVFVEQSSLTLPCPISWGFLKWKYPNSWMICFMDNPNKKWMMTAGTPMTQETPMTATW